MSVVDRREDFDESRLQTDLGSRAAVCSRKRGTLDEATRQGLVTESECSHK